MQGFILKLSSFSVQGLVKGYNTRKFNNVYEHFSRIYYRKYFIEL